MIRSFICHHSQGRTKKKTRHLRRTIFFFRPSRGGRGVRRPHPPPITPHNFLYYAKNPHSKSYIIKGQGGYYRADRQPPGRAAAACVPATHSAEQRRKRERARESGHNEHSLHGEGTPATTLLRQHSLATKRRRKASRWRALHLLLRGQLR